MKTVRDVKDQVEAMKAHMARLLRARSLRDPLADLAPTLTSPQVHAIAALGINGTLPMSTLAQRIQCGLPSASGVVDRLEREGFVERVKDPDDRRVVRVALTAKGHEAFARLDEHMTQQLTLFFQALSEHDGATFIAIMQKVVVVVEDMAKKQATTTATPESPPEPTAEQEPE